MSQNYLRVSLVAVATAAALTVGLVPSVAFAYDENSTSAVNVDSKGIGLHGYDPVAYHSVGAPTPGSAEFTAKHNGVTYLFASAANRSAFKANPGKYEPAYGGFCAMGVALEKKLDGDPNAWKLVDGKLYLNVNQDVQKKWLEDVPGNNKKADTNWPSVKSKTPKSLA